MNRARSVLSVAITSYRIRLIACTLLRLLLLFFSLLIVVVGFVSIDAKPNCVRAVSLWMWIYFVCLDGVAVSGVLMMK